MPIPRETSLCSFRWSVIWAQADLEKAWQVVQWGAAAKAIGVFGSEWDFVEMGFEVVDAKVDVDVAFG